MLSMANVPLRGVCADAIASARHSLEFSPQLVQCYACISGRERQGYKLKAVRFNVSSFLLLVHAPALNAQ